MCIRDRSRRFRIVPRTFIVILIRCYLNLFVIYLSQNCYFTLDCFQFIFFTFYMLYGRTSAISFRNFYIWPAGTDDVTWLRTSWSASIPMWRGVSHHQSLCVRSWCLKYQGAPITYCILRCDVFIGVACWWVNLAWWHNRPGFVWRNWVVVFARPPLTLTQFLHCLLCRYKNFTKTL